MEISKDTQEVLIFLDYYTSNNLRKRNDLAIILEVSATFNLSELVTDIIFYGTSLWKVYSVLKKLSPEADGYEKLEQEFRYNSEKLLENIYLLSENFSETARTRFETTYFGNSQGSLRNLVDLAFDLAQLKEVQTKLKSMKNK